jgi:Ni/Fe-hydrogenase subunit HybB-like protein
MTRVRRLKLVLWLIAGMASAVAVSRFLFGLGAATNLSDATPWGLWIGFDVLSGVALAAGGFILTASVYVFRLERFRPLVRPAVLTAFLGYVAVVAGLLFDLGLPWNIWHMLIFWNPHSPLFEVGWCVMLYLAVLALEFFPVAAEEITVLARVRRFLVKLRLPLVITGVGLSTLHQSSLGSLFLIMPYYLHPLWYSPSLPVLFLVSAVGLGLLIATFESHSTGWLYRRKPETGLLSELGAVARWVLLLYLVLRFADLAWRGQLHHLAERQWQVWMFWFEISVAALLPAALLFIPRVRRTRQGQWAVATLGIFGIVLNRINTGGLVQSGRGGQFYLPAITEVIISTGVVAGIALVFLFLVERLRVWEERPADPEAAPVKLPEFDPVGTVWLGMPAEAARTVYSLGFALAAALAFAVLAPGPAASQGLASVPARQARGGEVLFVDGNRDGYGTSFPHDEHAARLGGKTSCVRCHHWNLPHDRNSGCYHCHRQMYRPADAFRHDWHASPAGGRLACTECHRQGEPRTAATAKPCEACHKDLKPAGAVIPVKQYQAPGYVDTMHRLCIGCHVTAAKEKRKPDLARCANCHKARRGVAETGAFLFRTPELAGKHVSLPPGAQP